MNSMDDRHSPDRAFRDGLEREVLLAFRDETRFVAQRDSRRRRTVHSTLLLFLGILLGVGTGFASNQVQDTQQRRLLLEEAESRLRLATLRLELATSDHAVAQKRHEVGAISQEVAMAAETAMKEMEANLQRIRLEIEEVAITARPARDELTAPLVGTRDFVSERLQLRTPVLERQLRAAEARAAIEKVRTESGIAPPVDLVEAESGLARATGEMQLLVNALELRGRFLSGQLAPEEVARRRRQFEIQNAVAQLRLRIRAAEERHEIARVRQQMDVVTHADVLRAQLEMLELQSQMEHLILELQLIQARGRGGSP